MLVEIRCGPAMLIDRIEKVGTARKRRRKIEALTCKGNGFDPVVYKAVFNHIRAGNDVGRLTEGFKIWKEPVKVTRRGTVTARFPEIFRKKARKWRDFAPDSRRRLRKIARLSSPYSGVAVRFFYRLIPRV